MKPRQGKKDLSNKWGTDGDTGGPLPLLPSFSFLPGSNGTLDSFLKEPQKTLRTYVGGGWGVGGRI